MPTWCTIYSEYIYQALHVSGDYVPIIRRNNCVCAALGTCYSEKFQNNKYQVSHKHSCFSWWWAHSRPKHVELDKYTQKFTNSYRKIQQDATVYQNFIIPYLNEAQHVSGDTPPIIRSLKLHKQLPVLHTWKVVGRVVVGR